MPFNSGGMLRACIHADGRRVVKIYRCSRRSRSPATDRCAISSSRSAAERRHRPERQRQVEPVPRAAAAGRHRAGPGHSFARARRRAAVDAVGRPRELLARGEARRAPGAGRASARSRSACAWASPATTSATRSISAFRRRRSGAFGHDPEIKRECIWSGQTLAPVGAARRSARAAGARRATRRRVDDRHARTRELRQHDDALRRSAEHARDADAARADARAGASTIISAPTPTAPARPPQIGTHTPVLEQRRRRPRGGAADHPRDRRSATRSTGRSTTRFPGASVSRPSRRLVRGRDAAARPAAAAEGRRALRRHAALSAVDRGAADAAPAAARWCSTSRKRACIPSSCRRSAG